MYQAPTIPDFPGPAGVHLVRLALAVLLVGCVYMSGYVATFAPVYLFFFLTLGIASLAANIRPVGQAIANFLNWFADSLARRGAFRSDPEREAPKFALIRIAFGLFMVQRAYWVFFYLYPTDWADAQLFLFVVASGLCAALVCVGLLTQYALIFLVLVQWQVGDAVMGTSTLGNDIAAMLSLLLIFANAGAHLSVDGWLARRKVVAWSQLGYYPHGIPSKEGLQIAKFLGLLSYWGVCVYSLAAHLSEPAWMSGVAGPMLLTNNFMCRFYSEFTSFFELGHWAVALGKLSLWSMLPWYGLLLPFVLLGGIWRTYAIAWAVLFFCLSLFVLHLGWLAEFEFLFFAALFWQRVFIAGPGVHLAYDDRCNLCDRTVKIVKLLDIFRQVELRPISQNGDWLRRHGIEHEAAMRDLCGVDVERGRHFAGYNLYVALSRHLLLLLPLYVPLLLGRWSGIGPAVYRYIADRRTALFGVCEMPSRKPEYAYLPVGRPCATGIRRSDR